jgi:hypothetical protein
LWTPNHHPRTPSHHLWTPNHHLKTLNHHLKKHSYLKSHCNSHLGIS